MKELVEGQDYEIIEASSCGPYASLYHLKVRTRWGMCLVKDGYAKSFGVVIPECFRSIEHARQWAPRRHADKNSTPILSGIEKLFRWGEKYVD